MSENKCIDCMSMEYRNVCDDGPECCGLEAYCANEKSSKENIDEYKDFCDLFEGGK
jgi:hypothetical protein